MTDRHAELAADIDAILPAWEANYEPGNVSDYLIALTNGEPAAKGAAEAWLKSERHDDPHRLPSRLEWVPDAQLATGRYDQWFELIEHDPDLGTCTTGINVRHRRPAA